MSAREPLPILFLWHHHQPCYRLPDSSCALLPWVRLHAARGYTDMAAVCESEGAQVTFNFTPVLLEQIAEQAEAQIADEFERVSQIPVHDLTEEERCSILEHFFFVNWEMQVRPLPRYAELLSRRGEKSNKEEIRRRHGQFSDSDILDLTVLFHLAWMGFTGRKLPEIRRLLQKGRDFTEDDRTIVLGVHRQLLRSVIPIYRRLAESGVAELSTSPFAHPILPLLCDSSIAAVDLPKATLPAMAFQHPEDARGQLEWARETFHTHFDRAPEGLWPSEGSVSEEAMTLAAASGFRWAASDEENLYRSQTRGQRPLDPFAPFKFQAGEREIILYFRERRLSDEIGFHYARRPTSDSVADFCAKLYRIADKTQGKSSRCVAVILDGENPWEYFPDGGEAFLRGLYRALKSDPKLCLSTYTNHLSGVKNPDTLSALHAGSWIDANFRIWIGNREKNRAWDLLRRMRNHLELQAMEALSKNKDIRKALYFAEGSDWFWWFGEPFHSSFEPDFDRLFRGFLQQAFVAAKLEVPSILEATIAAPDMQEVGNQPVVEMTPTLDGRVTSFYEWVGAACVDTRRFGVAMGQSERFVQKIYYGFDSETLHLRIDFADDSSLARTPPLQIGIELFGEEGVTFIWRLERGCGLPPVRSSRLSARVAQDATGAEGAVDNILEISIPLYLAGLVPGSECSFAVAIWEGKVLRERLPREGTLRFRILSKGELAANWTI